MTSIIVDMRGMTEQKIRIIVDQRELRSPVAKELEKLNTNIDIEFDTISVGDYVLSRRVGVERKTAEDFLKSWLDEKKIWTQLRDLEAAYEIPLLIIEGFTDSLYTLRQVHPHAVQGILRSIMVGMRIPIIWTLDAQDTAAWLFDIAKSEQDTDKKRYFSWHGKRSGRNLQEQLEYALTALPDMGIVTARNLLLQFKSLRAIVNAEEAELLEVQHVGVQTAKAVFEFFRRNY